MADQDQFGQQPNPQPAQPGLGPPLVASGGVVDAGLIAWADMVKGHIAANAGVEDVQVNGGSIQFKFRGQSFMVTVTRTA